MLLIAEGTCATIAAFVLFDGALVEVLCSSCCFRSRSSGYREDASSLVTCAELLCLGLSLALASWRIWHAPEGRIISGAQDAGGMRSSTRSFGATGAGQLTHVPADHGSG
jgi:hypothetical protein